MKKLVLVILTVISTTIAYGQVTLRVDSLDISRVSEAIIVRRGGIVEYQMDTIIPRIRVIATIKNYAENKIFVHFPDNRGDMKMRFPHRGHTYYQNLGWKNPTDYRKTEMIEMPVAGLWIAPGESKEIELWTYIPPITKTKQMRQNVFFSTYPSDFDWGKENMTDIDYAAWFKEILPKMKIIVSYGYSSFHWKIHEVISDPIDLEKVIVTSNLTDGKLIDIQTLEEIRDIDEYIQTGIFPERDNVPN